ncbi:hypothetical protein [Weissella cibaria]|uniref:hypothetical protein n=1 Tax=Weissella cibaria TaxID=137591 RepID=UPI001367EEC4|nr:hypothetical protein [Weissella cibaria]MBZ5940802.1 hypothetical protein [Weissella cibaria]MYV35659.1 hypothetical protein [Weissella cibaria]
MANVFDEIEHGSVSETSVEVRKIEVEGLDELKKLSQKLVDQAEQLSNTIERINQLKLVVSTGN